MLNINRTHDNLLLKRLKVPNFTFAAYFFYSTMVCKALFL